VHEKPQGVGVVESSKYKIQTSAFASTDVNNATHLNIVLGNTKRASVDNVSNVVGIILIFALLYMRALISTCSSAFSSATFFFPLDCFFIFTPGTIRIDPDDAPEKVDDDEEDDEEYDEEDDEEEEDFGCFVRFIFGLTSLSFFGVLMEDRFFRFVGKKEEEEDEEEEEEEEEEREEEEEEMKEEEEEDEEKEGERFVRWMYLSIKKNFKKSWLVSDNDIVQTTRHSLFHLYVFSL